MIKIDFNNIDEEMVYTIFEVDGKEGEALSDMYLELFELIGKEAMLKLHKFYKGDRIDIPMRLFRPEFIADIARGVSDRRERAKIARAAGYSSKAIENILAKRKNEGEND